RWRGEQGLWGAHREERRPIPLRRYLGDAANEEVYCELRYQGQLYDAETGLYYNRHRYYDAESGQYLSPDPIGLLGGNRPQAYVHNPLEWVDPFGLDKKGAASQVQKNKAVGDSVRDEIAAERGTDLIEQNFRVPGGLRRMDVVDGTTGIESKVGRTGLTSRVRQEVARDIKILRSGQLDRIEWVFTRSPTTGKIGPTKALENVLNKHGIPIVYR
ncbi:RHS repeat-associated core domain-containing protein, partial [Pectobacterium versatile]|uniref:RHS repeat-associated core domain-containing protein n=1 Tax=Pectobacterium versatile TaxID=2488639 RepID=UPI001F3CB941